MRAVTGKPRAINTTSRTREWMLICNSNTRAHLKNSVLNTLVCNWCRCKLRNPMCLMLCACACVCVAANCYRRMLEYLSLGMPDVSVCVCVCFPGQHPLH